MPPKQRPTRDTKQTVQSPGAEEHFQLVTGEHRLAVVFQSAPGGCSSAHRQMMLLTNARVIVRSVIRTCFSHVVYEESLMYTDIADVHIGRYNNVGRFVAAAVLLIVGISAFVGSVINKNYVWAFRVLTLFVIAALAVALQALVALCMNSGSILAIDVCKPNRIVDRWEWLGLSQLRHSSHTVYIRLPREQVHQAIKLIMNQPKLGMRRLIDSSLSNDQQIRKDTRP